MIDIKLLRENPELVKENMKKKYQEEKLHLVDEVVELDEKVRAVKTEGDNLRAERNKVSKEIGALMGDGKKDLAEEAKAHVNEINDRLTHIEVLLYPLLDNKIQILKFLLQHLILYHRSFP